MSKIDEKLKNFAADVMSDVGEERRLMVDALDEHIRQVYEEKENEYLAQAYEFIQDSLVKIDQKKSESLSRIIMSNRSRLFEKRSELLEGIYSKAAEALVGFKKENAYKEWLVQKVKAAESVLGEGDIWVTFDASDASLKSWAEETLGVSVRVASPKLSMMGGCVIENKTTHTIVDFGFASRLEDAKEAFAQQCQLEID